MKKKTVSYFVFAAVALLFIHCGGGEGVPRQLAAVESLSRGVRVGLQFTQPTVEGYLDFLSPQVRADAEAQGFIFRATEVVYPTVPAIGYYLKIGDTFIPSGPNGEFYIPKDMRVPTNVPLYKQLSDTAPIGSVNIAGALRPASEPLRMVVLPLRGRVLGSAEEMDGTAPSRAAGQANKSSCCQAEGKSRAISDGCTRIDCDVTTNDPSTGCCYDFDLTKGRIIGEEQGEDEGEEGRSRKRVEGFCVAKRVAEFYGTECYKWTVGSGGYSAACINERAILQVTGPSCWANHKYRFCQNMRMTDFSISATGTVQVQVGHTLFIIVHNNTPANETMVNLSGNANGTLLPAPGIRAMSGGAHMIEHYDDSALQHMSDRTIVYKAPDSLPNGQTEANDTLVCSANGITKTLTMRVVQKCGDTREGGPCY